MSGNTPPAHHVKYATETSDLNTDVCVPRSMSGVSNGTEGRIRPGRAKHLMRTWCEVEEVSCSQGI